MSDQETRIIQHMNRDHQLALVDYLAIYGNISPSSINTRSARISSIDTEKFVINYVDNDSIPRSFTIHYNNATENESIKVNSLGDLRSKFVAMAHYAAEKQGFSTKQITKVLYPSKPGELFMYLIAITAIYAGAKPKQFARKVAPLAMNLLQQVPDWAGPALTQVLSFSLKYGELIFKAIYAIHIVEILLVGIKFTRKYRVPWSQSLQWYFMHFFEGFFVIKRYNKLAREAEEGH